ncbi:hypothetical protein BDV28DRAFT_156842 [Aspergillus coremiiformis]|uniref:N-acetylglucosamine-induced protein 1 n=1 Tax=Aspergillus coremiiformis TaxID=138285 RepID=A0A5N6Z948_9EURO|nr:hypothetical protein BDV28DRAFT_156842 [Aspergillus coremiiformis]
MSRIIDIEELIRNPPFELSKADKEILTTAEEDFVPHTWEDLQATIAGGDTSQLKRTPGDLRNYILWTREIQAAFGSATNFVVQNRLHWKPEANNAEIRFPCRHSTPFADQSDYRILRNDWPYGMSPGMVHLVIWLKMSIPLNEDGDPTAESRRRIEEFLERTFAMHMSERPYAGDNIQWFKNRVKWQSVRALEHIHVILRGADDGFVTKLTGQGPGEIECKSYSIAVGANLANGNASG